MIEHWQYSTIHNSNCKVLEEQSLWGKTVCQIWLSASDTVVKVPKESLEPVYTDLDPEIEKARMAYITAAAKVAEVLEKSSNREEGHVLLAPMDSKVIPLPHQIHALSRAVSNDRVRYLLADEVGLGKTIEAGLILRELKLRGLVRRTLVVSPKGIATQWVSEMQTHFNENFQLILGGDLKTLHRISATQGNNLKNVHTTTPWNMFDQVIVSLDSVKPMDKRQGWSKEKIDEYNQSRFENLITAGWDLIIVDESHRLGGSTDQVARYKLGKGLAKASPYLLLLSATPHQGKTDAFHRLISLLDETVFPDVDSISKTRVAPFIIRTEKRKALDGTGKPLFKPRQTKMFKIHWEDRHCIQERLYKAVTDYVQEGYNQAILDKNRHIGFLMILMQRLVVSSTRAIRSTLEKRLAILQNKQYVIKENFNSPDSINSELSDVDTDAIYDMDAQELLEKLMGTRIAALKNEAVQVETLLNIACNSEQAGPDAKAESLMKRIYQLQSEENQSDLKILIFTEFIPTQQMLKEFLEDRGISVAILNGSMDMEQRRDAQETFKHNTRVLVSTDAGGEGLNLQFCHVVINYDIPWNPMRLEQRIGRVDRIGQPKTVRAINFIFENSVEFRVREILEEKLSVIFKEFGIDKTGDVLDSARAGEIFENIFTSAILSPDDIEQSIDQTMVEIKQEMGAIREESAIYGISEELDINAAQRLRSHPLPYWIEKMITSYIKIKGGESIQKRFWWELHWPDNTVEKKVVFNSKDALKYAGTNLLNLENPKVKNLALQIPQVIKSQPIPRTGILNLPKDLDGYWGLFEIRISSQGRSHNSQLRAPIFHRGFLSVFSTEDGKVYLPTARHIWDTIINSEPVFYGTLPPKESVDAFEWLQTIAEDAGQELFNTLQQNHLRTLEKEKTRGSYFFNSRKKSIELIGLPEVRQYRLNKLVEEKTVWLKDLERAGQIIPEIKPLLLLKIEQKESHG
ncbi:MAG: helicase-related protein [Deltaproteobacteria bacterium]|nr:helicase-related protein [Deltaproteobacteria bacterium]